MYKKEQSPLNVRVEENEEVASPRAVPTGLESPCHVAALGGGVDKKVPHLSDIPHQKLSSAGQLLPLVPCTILVTVFN